MTDSDHAQEPDIDPPVTRSGKFPKALLDEHAVFVVKRLQKQGHEAYLVGGCVRDLLAGLEPKDFDVATDAHPNRIRRLFRSARVIGRRFRLVHVTFPGNHVIETSTFRADPPPHLREPADEAPGDEHGDIAPFDDDASSQEYDVDAHDTPPEPSRPPRKSWESSYENVFGTAPEDARRRDFTINALYYDPVADEVIDYVGGLDDMEAGVVRSIGDPVRRIHEDPVRMLRAIHFAARLDFDIEPTLDAAIRSECEAIKESSYARLYIELIKMLTRGRARTTMRALFDVGVLEAWLPELTEVLSIDPTWPTDATGTHAEASQGEPEDLPVGHATWNLLGAADRWGPAAHRAPDSLALATLFGPWILDTWRQDGGGSHYGVFSDHVDAVFRPIALRMSIPRWAVSEMRDALWMLDALRHPPQHPRKRIAMMRRTAFPVALALLQLDLDARDCDDSLHGTWCDWAREERIDPRRFRRAQQPRGRRKRGNARSGRNHRGNPARGGRRGGKGRGGRRRNQRGRGGRRGDGPPSEEASAWMPPPPT